MMLFSISSLILATLVQSTLSRPELVLDAYPARVHENSPPDTLILTITGYDNATGQPLNKLSMEDNINTRYFKITPTGNLKWYLSTRKIMNKPENYTFEFRIFGSYEGVVRDTQVKIIVSSENIYAPYFSMRLYKFVALRDSLNHSLNTLGAVSATDEDIRGYNAIFRYFIFEPEALKYFKIDPENGQIGIISNFPENMTSIAFNVTAIDSGSPIKSSSSQVYVEITDLAPPEIFCVSVEGTTARICWKDNTNGSAVDHYQLQFAINGQNVTSHPVGIVGKRDEVCTQVRAGKLQAGNRLKFTIKVYNKTHWSPESVERFVNITKDGLYGDCPKFSNCSVFQPCQNKGVCQTEPDLSYKCKCSDGWAGRNCTEINKCTTNPCLNNATCEFLSNNNFRCNCPSDFYGNLCQFHDKCISNPCLNNGTCFKQLNGSFHCQCPEHFSGSLCENEVLCSPNPCENGGTCSSASGQISCTCPDGVLGTTCDVLDICKSGNPCENGKCSMYSDGTYNCLCDEGYAGENCTERDVCFHNLCENNSTCVRNDTIAKCSCIDGFYGEHCQYVDKCHGNPCENGGTCNALQDGSFECLCENGYSGKLCGEEDPCVSNPCKYDGTCKKGDNSTFTCDCVAEKYGPTCEHTDGCKLSLCQNNSTCKNISTNGAIQCICKDNFFGTLCDRFNPCDSSPCQNSGICQNLTNNGYRCHCHSGWTGSQCQHRDRCLDDLCQNHGTCHPENDSFHCDCKSDFYGERCTKYKFCTAGKLCRNGANCDLLDGEVRQMKINGSSANITNWYKCRCPDGFTGMHCDQEAKPCDGDPCGSQGVCQERGRSYICYCLDGTRRRTCINDFCPADDTALDRTGRHHWPRTWAGDEVRLNCPLGTRKNARTGYATRKCEVGPGGKYKWLSPNTDDCVQLSPAEADVRLHDLVSSTRDRHSLTPEKVASVTNDLENLAIFANDNEAIAKEMTTVISNILDAKESVLIESDHRNHSSRRLVELLTEYADAVVTENSSSIATDNINLLVVNISDKGDRDFTYKPILYNNETEEMGVELKVPKEVMKTSSKASMKLHIITYRTSAFFIPEIPTPEEIVLKQRVLSATVQGVLIKNLSNPIHYTIPNIESDTNHTCVYWDRNRWSTEGVTTVSTGGNATNCYTTHLTSFAVMLDPTPNKMLPDSHEKALTYISYIGCAISIFGLAFTIVTVSMFRSLNRERSGKILLNMCVSMLLMNVTFILMAETSKSDGMVLCMITAILLHYFLLTSLMWMCTEAINMYQALIKVFTTYSSYFILKRCIVAWGVPLVVVGITMGVNQLDNYRTKTNLCMISQANTIAFYVALLGPACVILVINTIVFTLVARVIMKPRFKGSIGKNEKEKVSPAQVRGAFTVMVLLGVTWVFGPVAIKESKIVFNYLFTILNSLQGFLIFVFRCLLNTEARSAWVLLIKTGTFKRRRGPIVSQHESCSKGGNDSRGHLADSTVHTGRTTLHNSNENIKQMGGKQQNGFQWKHGKSEPKLGHCSPGLGNGKRHSDEYELRKEFDDLTKL
ncbi:adhesion G protein-coupled receptor B1-like isoform X2 [Ostrea edulis]|uniref:adhesion G protein-coupled receptor B1-like isoform X2 n=1 Tax=Ostrea edulis TaxID=37623 RepID=UPI0024AF1C96|nr:adhesion G protein-coupled receptor B1-like isoform X2 [Ostrea edulis]